MAGNDAWLGLTIETALEPELSICDPHHHLWEYPGSRYLLEEFTADLEGGHRVESTVYVECLQHYREHGPASLRPVGETEYVGGLVSDRASGTDVARGIVGFADLSLGERADEVLDAHLAASGRFRGIRHATAWHADERIHDAHTRPGEGLMREERFLRGFACLAERGLVFDAWLYHTQLEELRELLKAFPETTVVLDHMAGPLGIGPYADDPEAVFTEWRSALESLAPFGNLYVKLGGRTMTNAGFRWHKRERPPGSRELAVASKPYFDACIDLFGANRCMFESNFPVDRASCSYTVLWNAFKHASRDRSEAERKALFHDTATAVYSL